MQTINQTIQLIKMTTKLNTLQAVLDGLMLRYKERVPDVAAIVLSLIHI